MNHKLSYHRCLATTLEELEYNLSEFFKYHRSRRKIDICDQANDKLYNIIEDMGSISEAGYRMGK